MQARTRFLVAVLALCSLGVNAQIQQLQEYGPGISARLQYEIDITKDPATGIVPKDKLITAYRQRQERINANAGRAPLFNWVERGPYLDAVGPSNGNTRPGNGITSGRVRAIWEDLADISRKTVWVGGVDGGLWKTDDITATPAVWTPINDFFTNLAIGSICQDPSDHNILYFGTGEKAINADAVRGAGIWKSTDHGLTWNQMPGTANYWNISKLLCDANGNLYAGCNSISNAQGVLRYTKSTGTWTNITPSGLAGRVPDMVISSTGRLHITCGYYNTAAGSSGYRYTDNPATVTSSTWSSPATTFTTQYNVALACSGNTLYALPAIPSGNNWEVPTIYKSTNGGVNWSALSSTPAFTSGQAWYCMGVAIDPTNDNNVIVGSLDCYRSTNGGTSWSKVSNWVGTSGQYVHADQQIILWNDLNRVLVGSDGGVHLSTDGGSTYRDKNTGLRIKQFYAVAIHPTSANYFLAGAQDNGVHQLNGAGLASSVEVTGGDGAFVHIDQDQPQYQWGSYVYNQYRRSTDGGASWASVNYSSTAGRFINPTDYDNVNNIMYCSGTANTFVRWSNPQSGSTFTQVSMSGLNNGTVSAVKVSPYSNNTVYFAGGAGSVLPVLIRAANANATPTFTNLIGASMQISGANISCVELGTDENNIIVTFSNYGVNNVWVTTNGGASWTSIDGNLPDMPVRWAMFYPGDNTRAIIATETGIWQTELVNGTSTVWDPETGFPNVKVNMLQYRASDKTLIAATHGRGLFTTTLVPPPSCGTPANLSATGLTTATATLNWSPITDAVSYDVDYKVSGSATWTSAASATVNTSIGLSGLAPGTTYDWRVRSNCASATSSYATASFTTAYPCGLATGLAAADITINSATISWVAVSGANSYDVDYKVSTSTNWTNAATATSNTSVGLSGLNSGTLYNWRVRVNCAEGTGNYVQSQFSTAFPPCGTVTGLNTTGITSVSVIMNWSALSGANDYTIDFKENTAANWSNAATAFNGTSLELSNLNAATLYDWRVRANCSGSSGPYAQAQFTTDVPCPGPYDVSTNGKSSGAATIPFNTDIKGLINTSNDVDFYKFVITTGGTISLGLSTLPADYDLDLYKGNSRVASSKVRGTGNETINYTAAPATYYAKVFGYNRAFNTAQCYTLRVNTGTAGIQNPGPQNSEINSASLILFPNPARDRLTIYVAGYDKQKQIEIFNMNGQRLFTVRQTENAANLDISKLSKGLYLVRVSGADGSVVSQSKFVKE